jgi:DNA processing protein
MAPHLISHDELLSWLRFTLVPGVSLGVQRSLLNCFGTPRAILETSPSAITCVAGNEVAEALRRGPDADLVQRTLAWLDKPDRHLLTLGSPGYPPALAQIFDPPTAIYASGDLQWIDRPCVAIVGSRNATPQGAQDAQDIAGALSSAGCCIVSGLASGIDAAAHRGGLSAIGSTVAVMGTGPDIIYPTRNRALACEIAARGCLLTEFPLAIPSLPGNFPRRNRIISGLSRGVLVVEAARQSGSLITARFALEQGRDVFAVPGSIHSPLSKGCHDLIKQGAKLVENAGDVLEELALTTVVSCPALQSSNSPQHPLLVAMGFGPVTLDQLAAHTAHSPSTIAAQLSRLEVEGHVSALPGGRFQRVDRIE